MAMKIILASAMAAILAAVPAAAQESKEEKKTERFVIIQTEDADRAPAKVREFRTRRMAEGGRHHVMLRGCEGEKTEVEQGDDKEKTRISICGKAGLSGEERAKELEAVRIRLAERDLLGAESRARLDAALQEAINRARAGK